MFIYNKADNNGVLRIRLLKLNVCCSSKACPLALMQRVARVTMHAVKRTLNCLLVAAFGIKMDLDFVSAKEQHW